MLKKKSEIKLLEKGLYVESSASENSVVYTIYKPVEVRGNTLKHYLVNKIRSTNDDGKGVILETDLPILALLFESNKWRVDCSEFIPFPGPGDFSIEFTNEELAINFIIEYFFEKNKYLEKFQVYLSSKQNL